MQLKRKIEKKIKNGYPWIYKDEVHKVLIDGKEGEITNVFSYNNDFLGKGFYNPHSHIMVRMLTNKDIKIDKKFFQKRIQKALILRESFEKPFYRLIHSEGDALPGLIVDRYNEGFVIQIRSKGMENFKNDILDVLINLFKPKFIYERSDFESYSDEKIDKHSGELYGETPELIEIEENGIKFFVNVKRGQKTGFFFDQRKNRLLVRNLNGKKALDLFTYTGGFALNLAFSGKDVIAIDKSKFDIDLAKENAKINSLNSKIEFLVGDVFEFLKEDKSVFDIVIADPPSLIKRKEERKKGISHFINLVKLIEPHLKDFGNLVLCSCAYQIDLYSLIESVRRATESSDVFWKIENVSFQDIDHPWIAEIPESRYLTCLWMRKVKLWN